MDILSVIGVIVALVAIIGGNMLEGGHTGSLVQLTAFVIVVGGTLGAVLVQTPLPVFLHALKMTVWVVLPPKRDIQQLVTEIVEWSKTARKSGLLSLENTAEQIADPFTRRCLQLLVDGTEPDTIRGIMETEVGSYESSHLAAAKVFEAGGGYSPTIGIIGAVMGLIHVMENLSDPSKLGTGIAVAFVATIYGVGLANLLLLPMANKLKAVTAKQVKVQELILEGVVAIAQGENPRAIENRLQGFADWSDRKPTSTEPATN
jgi:chemotaxis protein MotA